MDMGLTIVVQERVFYMDTYGRNPSFLFVNEQGFLAIQPKIYPQNVAGFMYPVIGTVQGGRVLYVPELTQPYYWQDAIILNKAVNLNIAVPVDCIKVPDDQYKTKPLWSGAYGEADPAKIPTPEMIQKIHQVPVCVINAYREFLCN